MDLDALRFGNFSQLGQAITDWEEMAKKLATLEKDAKDNLGGKAAKARWTGENAAVTRSFVEKTAAEFADAHTQARTVARILADTRDELVAFRDDLTEEISRAAKKNLTVRDTGDGSFTVTMNIHPDRAAKGTTLPEHSQSDMEGLRDRVQAILRQATRSDTTAAEALRLIVDQAERGFSGADYADRDSAAKALAAAEALAKTLKKDPSEVTATELNAVNATLATYGKDPLFAEKLATSTTPDGLLTFYAGVADPYQGFGADPNRLKQAKLLQKNLGVALAQPPCRTAPPCGPGNRRWSSSARKNSAPIMRTIPRLRCHEQPHAVRRLRRPVPQRIRRTTRGVRQGTQRQEHEPVDQQLEQRRPELLQQERPGPRPHDRVHGSTRPQPGAATEFFSQPTGTGSGVDKESELNGNLKYLTKERIWLSDAYIMGGDNKVIAGHDSLGHALEAATTGYAYDADPMAAKDPMIPGNRDMRTAETAGVMEQVAFLYGSEDGPKMLHEQSQLADSLGKMGAAYIDDIDYSMSGLGDRAKDEGLFTPKYQGRADFGEQVAINFLSVIGQNETSHGVVSAAQHLYTLSMLDAHPPTNEANMNNAHDALTTGGEVRGILDHSRVQQAEVTYKDEAEEQNKSLGRSGDWVKLGAGVVVGGGIAAIPLPGSTAAALVVAPLAADTVGNAVNTFIGHEVDKGIDKAQDDPTEKAQLTSQEFYSRGIQQQADAYATYIGADPDVKKDTNLRDWPQHIENSYFGTGSQQNDYRGRPAHKD